MKRLIIGTAVLLSGCVVEPAHVYEPPQYQPGYPPPPQYQPQYQSQYQSQYQPPQYDASYQPPSPQPVVSVYVEPPMGQPAPVLVAWAPPPMLVEMPPPMPYAGAIWTGGYWVWEGNWVWAHGRWAGPPQPGYGWVNPYYENRGGGVVFVNGYWAAPGVAFVPPPLGISITIGVVAAGVIAGPRCSGPEGVFVPPPPGSHFGLIVPAPIGTAPAVVTSAPPIINQGMRITTVNNVRNISNVTNITNVTIVAPPGTTANGQAFNNSVPVQPHLAAAMTPVVKAYAPQPASSKPIPAYVAGHQPAMLPPAQVVHAIVSPAPSVINQAHPAAQQAVQPSYAPQPAAHAVSSPTVPVPDNRYQQNGYKPQQVEQKPTVPQPQQVAPKPQQYQQPTQQYQQPQQNLNQYKPAPEPKPAAQSKKPKEEGSEKHEHENEH